MAAEKPASDARRARLAKALKANIGRRKAQARAQEMAQGEADAAAQPAPGTPADEDGCPN
jgi:hypothetical protein